MHDSRRGILLAVLATGCMLAACDNAPSDAASAPAAASNKPAVPKGAGLPPDMVAAVSAGNSSAVISVHFALRATPVVNMPLPVDIAIVPHAEFASVRAHFEGLEGLALTTGDTLEPVTSGAPESIIKHQLTLLPGREGVYMLTAGVETEGADGTVTRVFSIPVIVAGQAAAPAAAPAEPAKPPAPATN